MALVTTPAIVLGSIKYGDTSLIVKCFTRVDGIKSYLVRGVLKASRKGLKPAYFQPLTQLEIVANHNNKGNLNSVKSVRVTCHYHTIYKSVLKQSIVFFISEVLSSSIQEEESNDLLYRYIETSLLWLDAQELSANFHLLFLLNLTKYLGFYPDITNIDKLAFDLKNGCFTDGVYEKGVVTGAELYNFKKLLNKTFVDIIDVRYSKDQRQKVLKLVIQYFQLHLNGFRVPNSLDVLGTVFS